MLRASAEKDWRPIPDYRSFSIIMKLRPPTHPLPRYLDPAMYSECDGVPFTTSSNLLYALRTALLAFDASRFEAIGRISTWLRDQLSRAGFKLVGIPAPTSPAVTKLALPESISSEWVGRKLDDAGFQLN